MAGLIEFSHDVIWYSSGPAWRRVLDGALPYVEDADAREQLEQALTTNGLMLPSIAPDQRLSLLRAIDHSAVRVLAELLNGPASEPAVDQHAHYSELRAMIRGELARVGEPGPGPPTASP